MYAESYFTIESIEIKGIVYTKKKISKIHFLELLKRDLDFSTVK